MAITSAEIFRDALALPPHSRAALVDSLLESLDGEPEGDDVSGIADEWRAEIRRRLDQIDSGAVKMIPWSEARKSLWARLDH